MELEPGIGAQELDKLEDSWVWWTIIVLACVVVLVAGAALCAVCFLFVRRLFICCKRAWENHYRPLPRQEVTSGEFSITIEEGPQTKALSPPTTPGSSRPHDDASNSNPGLKKVPLTSSKLYQDPSCQCIICLKKGKKGTLVGTDEGRRALREAAGLTDSSNCETSMRILNAPPGFLYHSRASKERCFSKYCLEKKYTNTTRGSVGIPETPELPNSDEESEGSLPTQDMKRRRRSLSGTATSSKEISRRDVNRTVKCIFCEKVSYRKSTDKSRIETEQVAKDFLEWRTKLHDQSVQERTAHLQDWKSLVAADIYYHNPCMSKWKRSNKEDASTPNTSEQAGSLDTTLEKYLPQLLDDLKRNSEGMRISDIREYLFRVEPHLSDLASVNKRIKTFLQKRFPTLRFSPSYRCNESEIVYDSSIATSAIISQMQRSDAIVEAAKIIREELVNTVFNIDGKVEYAEKLKDSWSTTPIPQHLERFLCLVYNVPQSESNNRVVTTNDYTESESDVDEDEDDSDGEFNEENDEDFDDDDHQDEAGYGHHIDNDRSRHGGKSVKVKALFNLMCNMKSGGKGKNKKVALPMMLGHMIYEKTKSKTILTILNKVGVTPSYQTIMRSRTTLAAVMVKESVEKDQIPLPPDFDPNKFTGVAVDNFDHNLTESGNNMSGKDSSHDTASVLFQNSSRSLPDHFANLGLYDKDIPENLDDYINLIKNGLECQKLENLPRPIIRDTLTLPADLGDTPIEFTQYDVKPTEFVYSAIRGNRNSSDVTVPTYQKLHIMEEHGCDVPLSSVTFLPVLMHPITKLDTVYTVVKNFHKLSTCLKQRWLPMFCDEGVYCLVIDLYLAQAELFTRVFPMLGSFHMAKAAMRSVGKYLTTSGIEDILTETGVFGIKAIEAALKGKNYVRALHMLTVIEEAIGRMKWDALWEHHDAADYPFVQQLRNSATVDKQFLENHSAEILSLQTTFESWSIGCAESSEVCQYLENCIMMIRCVKNLIVADRNGDWLGHVEAVKNLLPIFLESDGINYLRYATIYYEMIKNLDKTHPALYNEFIDGGFVVRRTELAHSAVGHDMCLEQTIQRSKKSVHGIIGNTREESYVTIWELIYHLVLNITKTCEELLNVGSVSENTELTSHHERSSAVKRVNTDVIKVQERWEATSGNPYKIHQAETQLIHFTSLAEVDDDIAGQITNYPIEAVEQYGDFHEERFIRKEKLLADRLTLVKQPTFHDHSTVPREKPLTKKQVKNSSNAEALALKTLHMAELRGLSLEECLSHDLGHYSRLFEEGELPTKAEKSALMSELKEECTTSKSPPQIAAVETNAIIVDFMATIRTRNHVKGTFLDLLQDVVSVVEKHKFKSVHYVFDPYDTVPVSVLGWKQAETARRKKSHPIVLASVTGAVPLPVDMDRFYQSSKNKINLQKLASLLLPELHAPDKRVVCSQLDSSGTKLNGLRVEGLSDLMLSEADLLIVPHIMFEVQHYQMVTALVESNDSDIVCLTLFSFETLKNAGLESLWVSLGAGKHKKWIPIHELFSSLGSVKSRLVLVAHIGTGCDWLAKIGSKARALKALDGDEMEDLLDFVQSELTATTEAHAERYLLRAWSVNHCKTFDQLRLKEYKKNGKVLQIAPTSLSINAHIKRLYFLLYNIRKILEPLPDIDPVFYGYTVEEGQLFPVKMYRPIDGKYTVTCGCAANPPCKTKACGCKKVGVRCTELGCKCAENEINCANNS